MTIRMHGRSGGSRRAPFTRFVLCALAPLAVALVVSPAWAESAAAVRVRDRVAFTLKMPRAGQQAAERARIASRALDEAADDAGDTDARVEELDDSAVIFAGKTPVVTLSSDDAAEAGESLHVYAATIAARVDDALRAEHTRRTIAGTVFSVSLLVFSALVAFLLLRRVGQLVEGARAWVRDNPERMPVLRLGNVEMVRRDAGRGAVALALSVGHLLAQTAIAYAWLLFSLSLFEATRAYTHQLTGLVVAPSSALVGRVGSALPVAALAAILAVAVAVLVRFVALFFESVARGDTVLAWLPRELAQPTSVLTRMGLVLASIVLAAPLLMGTDGGALSRVGTAALLATGMGAVPVLASAAAGLPTLFGRTLRPGQSLRIGADEGRVMEISALAISLEARDGSLVRVPHLLLLVRPTKVLTGAAEQRLDLVVDPHESQARVRAVLLKALAAIGAPGRVELVSLDDDGAAYRVMARPSVSLTTDLGASLAEALRDARIALGRFRGRDRESRTVTAREEGDG